MERIEVRAFGCLLEELLKRCDSGTDLKELWDLQMRCVAGVVSERPTFVEIGEFLSHTMIRAVC